MLQFLWHYLKGKEFSRGPEGPSQSPVAREMRTNLATMDKSLMTVKQCTLAPRCYHDKEKCFHKYMVWLEGASSLFFLNRSNIV